MIATPRNGGRMGHVKPKLTIYEQIAHMEARGIQFDICSKEDAAAYLQKKENYFRVAAYRKLFAVKVGGQHDGQYADLDFAYLIDLSHIDRQLSRTVLPMTLDIESSAKMKLIKLISEDPGEDGYTIVSDFRDQMSETAQKGFTGVLRSRQHDEYSGALIRKYQSDMPVWVLLEIGSFGTLVDFYRFCAKRWDDKDMMHEHFRLKQVKVIRNSTAHSSCVINGFGSRTSTPVKLNHEVESALAESCIGKKARKTRLRNPRVQQIVTLLYAYREFVDDEATLLRTRENIAALFNQIDMNADYYRKNSLIKSSFDLLSRLFDIWF
jgi:abortive infection bacteriophage resistance protein